MWLTTTSNIKYMFREWRALARLLRSSAVPKFALSELKSWVQYLPTCWSWRSILKVDVRSSPVVSLSLGCVLDNICHHGRNPDSVKTHVLNVIEMIYDALPWTATVFLSWRVAWWTRVITSRKSICNNLVDIQQLISVLPCEIERSNLINRPCPPVCSTCCQRNGYEKT